MSSTHLIEEMSLDELNVLIAEHVMNNPSDLWAFSSRIDRAMMVVAKMVERGLDAHLSFSEETGEPEWEAQFIEKRKPKARNQMRELWVAFDKELPRAICEAALRVTGKCQDPEEEPEEEAVAS